MESPEHVRLPFFSRLSLKLDIKSVVTENTFTSVNIFKDTRGPLAAVWETLFYRTGMVLKYSSNAQGSERKAKESNT